MCVSDGGGRNIISVHAVCTCRVGAKWSVGGAEYVHGIADGGWIQQVKKEHFIIIISSYKLNQKCNVVVEIKLKNLCVCFVFGEWW